MKKLEKCKAECKRMSCALNECELLSRRENTRFNELLVSGMCIGEESMLFNS